MDARSERHLTSTSFGLGQDNLPLLNDAWPRVSPSEPRNVRRKPVPSLNPVDPRDYARLGDEDITDARSSNYTTASIDPSNATSTWPLTRRDDEGRKQNLFRWLPYSLHWSYLSVLILVSVCLLALIVYLDTRSRRDDGLVDDDDQSILFFGWRFVPTLLAVLYALAVSILLEDIKRTEPFVRLAKPGGAPAEFTLLQVPGAWYNALADGLSRSKNRGPLSWAMICSAICAALASLVISPLSSTLLLPQPVSVGVSTDFRTFSISPTTPLNLSEQPMTRFHTISHLLQGVTTSAWLLDNYAVLPFWPSGLSTPPLGATLGVSPEVWQSNTTVFSTSLQCKTMTLQSKALANLTIPYADYGGINNRTDELGTIVLQGSDGCLTGLAVDPNLYFAIYGGASWSRPGVFAVTTEQARYTGQYVYLLNSSNAELALNYSSQCTGSERIVIATEWFVDWQNTPDLDGTTWTDNFTAAGLNCDAAYYYADMTVAAEVSSSGTVLAIDESEFLAKRQPLDNNMIDTAEFENMFLSANWSMYLAIPSGSSRAAAGGPSAVLAAMYGFSMEAMMSDSNIVANATRLKQRYLGEVLSSALAARGDQSAPTDGVIYTTRQRVVVIHSIAIALEVMLGVTTLLLTSILFLTRLHRRRMGLSSDPAYIASVVNLLGYGSHVGQSFKALKNASPKQQHDVLSSKVYKIRSGRLLESATSEAKLSRLGSGEGWSRPDIHRADMSSPMLAGSTDWRRFVVKRWAIATLGIVLSLFLAAVLLLYHFSEGSQLYQKAFVYQFNIGISGHHLSTIAPYSVIPTLLAVGVGLWWGAMETDFRIVQPFLHMDGKPVALASGVELSYQSSYLLWAAIKAAKYRHWLLCITSTGAVFSQIFITAMSALWTLDDGTRMVRMSLSRTLEPRVIPVLSLSYQPESADIGAIAAADIIAGLYGDLQTNWLYGAAIEMTLNGSRAPWSDEDWTFVPIDLSPVNKALPKNSTSSTSSDVGTLATVNLTTPALRARLDCSEYLTLSNESSWLTLTNPRNSSIWNTTANPDIGGSAYMLGCRFGGPSFVLDLNTSSSELCVGNLLTSFFNGPYLLSCCEADSDEAEDQAAIAYWSDNNLYTVDPTYTNFTVKWIYGSPRTNFLQPNDTQSAMMLWPEKPRLAALHCQPIIEKADAEIQIELPSNRIISHTILNDPVLDDGAFMDSFVQHPAPNETSARISEEVNVTTSYGWLFVTALLRAADLHHVNRGIADGTFEDLSDTTFNFRQPGINMDYMSYSMYVLAGQDKMALLNHSMLHATASQTFATFFQHFMSSNISLTAGGLSYQKINEQLPSDLLPVSIYNDTTNATMVVPIPRPVSNTNRTAEAYVSITVKVLHMSPVAVWICVGVLVWLILTVLVIVTSDNRYLGRLLRGTKTLADVAILLAGSDALLEYMANDQMGRHNNNPPRVRLGWFRDKTGQPRWGIELVGDEFGVEWLDESDIPQRKKGKDEKGNYEMVDMADRTERGPRVKRGRTTVQHSDVGETTARDI